MKYRNAFTFCFEHIVSLISSLFSPDASSDWPLKFLPFQVTLIQLSTTDILTHLLATLQVFTICCIDWIALRQDYVLIAGHTNRFSGSPKVSKFGIFEPTSTKTRRARAGAKRFDFTSDLLSLGQASTSRKSHHMTSWCFLATMISCSITIFRSGLRLMTSNS